MSAKLSAAHRFSTQNPFPVSNHHAASAYVIYSKFKKLVNSTFDKQDAEFKERYQQKLHTLIFLADSFSTDKLMQLIEEIPNSNMHDILNRNYNASSKKKKKEKKVN